MTYAGRLLRRAERLHAQGKIRKAIPLYQDALALDSQNPSVWYSAGLALIAMRDYAGGCKFLRAAIELGEDTPAPWYNLGMAYDAQGLLDDARFCYDKVLSLNPDFILAHVNLGSIYYRLGDKEKGYEHHSRALAVETANEEDKAGRALIRLLRGDYEKGWAEYEERWKLPAILEVNPVPTTGRRWYGEPLDGKPLLIWHEQGLGDTLMMLRYLSHTRLVNDPGKVTLMVQSSLKKLIDGQQDAARGYDVIERGEPCEFYWHAPFMSLAGCLGMGPVWKEAYIVAPELPHLELPDSGEKLTVGIYWQGSRHHNNDADRSCPFNYLRPLFSVRGVRWVSLQTPPEVSTLDTIKDATIYEMPFSDFTETAAAVEQCDIIITVDSAVGHLAGAMGKEVWLLCPSAPEFRWGLGDTTPWYPNHRLYRKQNWKAWGELINRVKTDLEARVRQSVTN